MRCSPAPVPPIERVATPEALFVVPGTRGAPGVPVARLPVVRRPGTRRRGRAGRGPPGRPAPVRGPPRRDLATRRHPRPHRPARRDRRRHGRARAGDPGRRHRARQHDRGRARRPRRRSSGYRTLLEPGVRLLAVSPSVAARLAGLLGMARDWIGVLPEPGRRRRLRARHVGRDRPDLTSCCGSARSASTRGSTSCCRRSPACGPPAGPAAPAGRWRTGRRRTGALASAGGRPGGWRRGRVRRLARRDRPWPRRWRGREPSSTRARPRRSASRPPRRS